MSAEPISQSKADDLVLMRGIAEQDPNALKAMYDKHASLVYTIAYRILRRTEDAEDLVSEVFFELWEKSSRYDQTRAAPTTYLVTLTRSRCIDRTRRKSYKQQMSMRSVDDVTPFSSVASPDNVSDREQSQIVRNALASLDPNQRKAVESAYYDGLSHTEIAEQLGKPLGTVKTYIRQGLIRLRDVLRKHSRAED